MLTAMILTSAGIIVVVAGIAYLLARRITRPIIGLSQGVLVIGSGNLDQRLEVHRSAPGEYSTALTATLDGRRLVMIEDAERNWRLAGEAASAAQSTLIAVP